MQTAIPSPHPLIGRRRPLEDLQRAVERARTGSGSLVLLSGEPGIGKTRLAEEIAAAAGDVLVLWGRCHEIEGRPPFWPWVQVLQACARASDPEALAASLSADVIPLAQFAPELRPYLDPALTESLPLSSDAARFRLFQAMTDLLRGLARRRPLLLILDDLHWADLPSLLLLEFLTHELPEVPIAVIGTYREIEVRRAPALSDIVTRLVRRATTIPLAGFNVAEVAQFIACTSGCDVPPEMADRLQRQTEGNPFFLDEIVRLAREGSADLGSGAGGLPISQGVRGTIQQRLAPLTADERQLLAAAAVAGRDFDLPLLEAALATSRAELLERLAAALAIEVVRPIAGRIGCFRFSHALVNETLRESLPSRERAALHQRFGEILEARYENAIDAALPEIAHHFFESAALGNEVKALAYTERAGEQALQLLAYEEAAVQFTRALHLAEIGSGIDPQRRCELLLRLGDAKNRAGQGVESTQAFHEAAALARRNGASALLARAAIGLCGVGTGWTEFGRSDELLVGILREALEQLGTAQPALRARVLSRLATELYWARPAVDTDALSAEAVELARRSGDRAALGYAFIGRLHCIAAPALVAERALLIDEILQISRGDDELALHAHLWRFGDLQQRDRMQEAHECGERLIQAVDASRRPGDQWLADAVHAQRSLLAGQLAEAEGAVEAILAQRTRKANAEQAAVALLFLVRRDQGRQAELAEGMRAFAYENPDVGVWRASLALLYAETGALAEARIELDALSGERLATLQRDNGWTLALACLAITCATCGTNDQAAAIYRILAPYDGENVAGGPFCFMGPVSYYLGLLAAKQGLAPQATRHLESALASAQRAGAPSIVARILVAQAQVLESQSIIGAAPAAELCRKATAITGNLGLPGAPGEGSKTPMAEGRSPSTRTLRAKLRADGDTWMLLFDKRISRLKALKGLDYIDRLLRAPGEEIHVLELTNARPQIGSPAATVQLGTGLAARFDIRVKDEMRARLADLRGELEEAEAHGDIGRAERARAEIDAMGAAVARAVGLGGRDRPSGAAAERARAAVTKAIRAAIREVASHEPILGEALTMTVKTGTFCSYAPLASFAIAWDMEPLATDADDA